jgi:acyl-coenzyme A thioesterase PaaI-like protein
MLKLEFKDNMKNHLDTFHASAQFALAEACSGFSLQRHFPNLADTVVPILRRSEATFLKPAKTDIYAKCIVDKEEKEKFEQRLSRKGPHLLPLLLRSLTRKARLPWLG